MPRAPAFLFSVLVAACSSQAAPPAPVARDAGVVRVPDAAVAVVEPTEAPPDAGVVADPAERLRAGQALEQKQKWRAAIAALEQAASTGDPAALQELAYAAVLAGDARRADAAVKRLLDAGTLDDPRRATALYHQGRAAELRGDLAAARTAYQQSLAIARNNQIADRLARLAARKRPPRPPAPPCARPMPSAELCGCLAGELAPDGTDVPRCIASHKHGGGAWAVTVVLRDRTPTYLVSSPAKGQVQALASLGDGELTITRWNVLRGPAGAPLVRVDTRTRGREDAMVCVAGAAARCLAVFPLQDKVGTPAVVRRLDLALEPTDDDGVAQLTLAEGPPSPSDLLGTHRLW